MSGLSALKIIIPAVLLICSHAYLALELHFADSRANSAVSKVAALNEQNILLHNDNMQLQGVLLKLQRDGLAAQERARQSRKVANKHLSDAATAAREIEQQKLNTPEEGRAYGIKLSKELTELWSSTPSQ